MTENDPTDEALATIASILEHPLAPALRRETDKVAGGEAAPPTAPAEADGYAKIGPGPMEAIRIKWTVRRAENGEYFVDETIGENLTRVVVGPMTREAAVKLVDEREGHARRRYEEIRSEMIGRVPGSRRCAGATTTSRRTFG